MSDAIYTDPDDPQSNYINMQRGRIVSNSTYSDNFFHGGSRYSHGQHVGCYQRGSATVGLLTAVLCFQVCSLSIGIYLLYRSGSVYCSRESGGGILCSGMDDSLRQKIEAVKSQLDYVLNAVSYSLPKEIHSSFKGELEKISQDVDKLEILVLSSVMDLNISLNKNNTFLLSTGSKVNVCQQYLALLKRRRSDRCKCDKCSKSNPSLPDKTRLDLPYVSQLYSLNDSLN
ncbi:transmembrane protein [Meliandou lophuromys virus]|uniref:Transmembrane protein n=1 Tax=Meliandou lophuromys virus TaxID=2940986 RepID=A0AAE9HU55_9MONO|nr:transmembrane protein [Meliandou lophuromys virus]